MMCGSEDCWDHGWRDWLRAVFSSTGATTFQESIVLMHTLCTAGMWSITGLWGVVVWILCVSMYMDMFTCKQMCIKASDNVLGMPGW